MTNLNKDLLNAENTLLDKSAREHLENQAVNWIEEFYASKIYKELKSLKEEKQWINWYLGYTEAILPFTSKGKHYTDISTTAVSGFMSSPFFMQNFSEDTFFKMMKSNLLIYLPANITEIAGEVTLVMKVHLDAKETAGGSDYLTRYIPDIKDQKFQFIQLGGYLNATWGLPAADQYMVYFTREIDTKSYARWNRKRMTGFSIAWHLENSTGHRVHIVQHNRYSGQERNNAFVRMVNILHQVFTWNNVSMDNIWEDLKIFRTNWLRLMSEEATKCVKMGMVDNIVFERFLDDETKQLNITEMTEPVYKDDVTDTILDTAAEMFTYLSYCPTDWAHFYSDLFRNFPPRYILQTLADLRKMQPGGTNGRNIPADLISVLGTYLQLESANIDLASEKAYSAIMKSKTDKLKIFEIELENCVDKAKCENIEHILRSIGGLLLEYD